MMTDIPLHERDTSDGADSTSSQVKTVPDLDEGTAISALDLLAHWWSRPACDEVATWRSAAELEEQVCSRMSEQPDRLSQVIGDIPALLEEYERLFIGPGPVPCPPYESYWRIDVSADIRNTLMGPCTADLNRLYGELGLQLAPSGGELPDHVAIEFEALAFALSLEGVPTVAKSLFFDHVKKWLPRLCRAVAREAETPFYKQLTDVTMAWLGPIQCYFESIVMSDSTAG
jgi:TorA maturation chaperone TorD